MRATSRGSVKEPEYRAALRLYEVMWAMPDRRADLKAHLSALGRHDGMERNVRKVIIAYLGENPDSRRDYEAIEETGPNAITPVERRNRVYSELTRLYLRAHPEEYERWDSERDR